MNTGENIAYNVIHKNGYIYSKSVRGSSKEVKDYVLNANDYKDMGDEYKFKSRVVNTNIWITNAKGKKVQVEIEQKQVVFFILKNMQEKLGKTDKRF